MFKDSIKLEGMSFYGYHGVTAAEKETGRMFEVDCELQLDLAAAAKSDRLSDTIDYRKLYGIIKDTVEGTAFALLEGLSGCLSLKILDSFPVERVSLKIRKLHPPIAGPVRYVEVATTRFQGDTAKIADSGEEQR